jgi:hypothetical protein
MKRYFLILRDNLTGEVLAAEPHKAKGQTASEVRSLIERTLHPGYIYHQLDPAPTDARILTAYVSPNRDGQGRSFCNFEQWAWR